jgi:S-formylglutathione hydrolase FrmB
MTVEIHSKAMDRKLPALVLLPENYTAEESATFPTLYMLHGYSGDYMGFFDYMEDLQDLSNLYQIIFVCPDGAYNSWYLDSPYGNDCMFETFISKELVAYIDDNFKTIKNKNQRAIMGLSMGGHGALYNAFRNPTVFGAAGSMSGGLDFTPFPMEWEISHRLGPFVVHPKRWEAHCVTNMIHLIPKDFPLMIDCGVDDFFIRVNRAFHEKLRQANIPHDYTERSGEHNWDYWVNATRVQLLFFHNHFKKETLMFG